MPNIYILITLLRRQLILLYWTRCNRILRMRFFNPSSPYAPAVQVKRRYMEAKRAIARVIGVGADELVMTAGATESVNLAMTAAGDGVCMVSAIEHASVLSAAHRGREAIIVPVDAKGHVAPDAVARAMSPEVSIVSVALANHEIGTVQALYDIAQIVQAERRRRQENGEKRPIYLHTDASQAPLLIDVKVKRLGVDLLTLSAAKVYGPKQVGLLWVRPGVRLSANILGGGQEGGLRSGTENVAGVVGFATALDLAEKRRSGEVKRLRTLRDMLLADVRDALPDVQVNGDLKKGLVSCLNLSFEGIDAGRLVFLLESSGVYVATGSACAANSGTKSSVLVAIGLSDDAIRGSIRISLGRLNDEAQVHRAAQLIIQAVRSERERLKRA